MIVSLDEVKTYLHLEQDYTEEDNLLQMLILGGQEYIKNATGQVLQNTNSLTKLACLIWITDRYENRSSADLTIKAQNALSYIITQLQYCYYTYEKNGEVL